MFLLRKRYLILILVLGCRVAFAQERIVSLDPAMTELIFALDLGSSLVGTSDQSDFPAAALKIERVGKGSHLSAEKIASLKPTLILGHNLGFDGLASLLRSRGFKVELFSLQDLKDYDQNLVRLGLLLHKQDQAKKLLDEWQVNWKKVSAGFKTKVLLQIDQDPAYFVGGKSFISQAFGRCGFENLLFQSPAYSVQGREKLASFQDPVVLVLDDVLKSHSRSEILAFWKKLHAGRVYFTSGTAFSRITPRMPERVREACSQLRKEMGTTD